MEAGKHRLPKDGILGLITSTEAVTMVQRLCSKYDQGKSSQFGCANQNFGVMLKMRTNSSMVGGPLAEPENRKSDFRADLQSLR
jgi:hypothetical protein